MQTCRTCGHEVKAQDQFCPNCGRRLDQYTSPTPVSQPQIQSQGQPFREQTPPFVAHRDDVTTRTVSILMLIFFYPGGLLYMWIFRPFTKKTRWIISLSFLAVIILGLTMIIWWTSMPGYMYLALF